MQIDFARRTRCGVCGFSEVRTDEAVDQGPIFLAECPRCEHRWTEPRPAAPPIRARAVRHIPFREVVTAA